MLKQTQRQFKTKLPKSKPPTLKKWVIQCIQKALGNSKNVKVRVRLRGNHLHLLCETPHETKPQPILRDLIAGIKENFQVDPYHFSLFDESFPHPIYQIIVYGKILGRKKHDWVKTINIHFSDIPTSSKENKTSKIQEMSGAMISYETLARSGSSQAIARYLSHQFSHLGVSIKVSQEKLPLKEQLEDAQHRLNVVCESNYSPEATLLAEPITQELRKLELHGFRESIIYAQVSGENEPEWTLKIDLTHPDIMLKEWANWGDTEAIVRLLNETLSPQKIQVRGELKQKTLHLFCSHSSEESPEQKNTVTQISNYLDSLSPQGIEAITIFGVRPLKQKKVFLPPDLQKEKPVWVDLHKLPASMSEELKKSPLELAHEDNLDALDFLVNRALNDDLDWRLETGGIQVSIKQKDDLLHILAEAVVCPAQTQVIQPLENLFRSLTINGVNGIRIYGRRSGQLNSLWHEGIDFIKRKSSSHDLLPEFTSISNLDIAPELLENDVASTEEKTFKFPKYKINPLKKISHSLQWLLGKSGLFISGSDHAFIPPSISMDQSHLAAYKGLKVAALWGFLGIFLTLQIDWIFGRIVGSEFQVKNNDVILTKATAETPPQPMTLPEFSLQKSEWENNDTSEEINGFTQLGSTEIISEVEARDDERKQQSVEEILTTYKENNPTFNNPFLEEKLALYQHRLETEGVADVMIIGSSRAMRGIDPYGLKTALKEQGYPELNIFNFGINGATVKIVDLVLRQLLYPDDLPKIVVFADGARAFNSGRNDMTYEMIENSEGYAQLSAGLFPPPREEDSNFGFDSKLMKPSFSQQYQEVDQWLNNTVSQLSSAYSARKEIKTKFRDQFVDLFQFIQLDNDLKNQENAVTITPNGIDYDGFFPVSIRFNPNTYYDEHPHVAGAYDGDYQGFDLQGEQHQSLLKLINYLKENDVQLVFINQPLTDNYLDQVRFKYEQEFNQYMKTISTNYPLVFRDFVNRKSWQTEYNFFSDPSHLNRYGAYQVSQELATDPMINWGTVIDNEK